MAIYLKKIELHGFKSFPEKTLIQFHRGLTAIIGPNGCGKSNLVDALLWVLGEQKIRNLRGETNEDLIFNGSASKKPLGMTEVGVFFDNGEEETYMARRFFRSGEAKYILNEKFCRNKDIQDGLYGLGIGDRNYFIFEQGAVEKMVSLKPTERRILIDEAAGIMQYLERKKETAAKLLIAQQNLEHLEVIMAEKSNRLKELKNQVQFVHKYRNTKTRKNEFLMAMLKKKYLHCQEEFNGQGQELEKHLNIETNLVRDNTADEEKILALEQERWNLERELKAAQQRIYEINTQMLNEQRESEKSLQRSEFLKQKVQETRQFLASNASESAEIEKQLQESGKALAEIQEQITSRQRQDEEFAKKLQQSQDAVQAMLTRRNQQKEVAFQALAQAAAADNAIQKTEKEIWRLQHEIAGKQKILIELQTQCEQENMAGRSRELAGVQRLLAGQEKELHSLQTEDEKLFRQCQAAEKELAAIGNEISSLIRQQEKYGEIKGKLQGQNAASPISGPGSLQEMISSSKAHHALLENFYFDELDAPIVDEIKAALNPALNKALIRSEQSRHIPEKVKSEKGYIDSVRNLFNLPDPKLKEYFQDGVVVDNLANGLEIFRRYGVPIISQRGELITANGLIIKSRQKGLLEVIEEIRALEKKISEQGKAAKKAESQCQALAERRSRGEEKLKLAQAEWETTRSQTLALATQIETLSKNVQVYQKRMQTARLELGALQEEEKDAQKQLAMLQEQQRQCQQGQEELEKKHAALDLEEERLQREKQQAEREQVENAHELRLLEEKHANRQGLFQELSGRKNRQQGRVENAQRDTATLENEIAALQEKREQLHESSQQAAEKKNATESRCRQDEEKLNAVNNELKTIANALANRRKALEDIREKKKTFEIALSALKKDLFQLEETAGQELHLELREIEAEEQLLAMELPKLEENLLEFTSRLNRMRENEKLNFSAESEFEVLQKDFQFLQTQKEDIVKSIQDLHAAIQKIDNESKDNFQKAFVAIRENFLRNFKILFEGGEAELTLTDPEQVFESGLEIQAQPPGKKLQSLRLLSGGEKTLTSLAFLFSLFEYRPSPFCVFDEVDASLDEANIQRFLRFLHQLKEKTQFIIITHNFKTMEEADFLYGISMEEPGISKIYSMKMN